MILASTPAGVSDPERIRIKDALGRVLAESVTAPIDLPPFDSSAMDGYAYRSAGVAQGAVLSLTGESLAGHPFTGTLQAGQCIRITTGAPVPSSADTVIIQENCELTANGIHIVSLPAPGENIRRTGHDVGRGDGICEAGKRLSDFDVAWLAACGITEVTVTAEPRVAVFSTGDELVEPGGGLRPGQIFDANRQALLTMLGRLPVRVTDLGILPDEKAAIETALSDAAMDHALLLTSGGVSVGDRDFVKDVVDALGRVELWRLNLKPGKPLAFGHIGDARFVGLPGNPVSTIVTYLLIAQPLILKLCGARPPYGPAPMKAQLGERVTHAPGREEYQRGIIERREDTVRVLISGDQSSNRLATFKDADCLIRVPKDVGNLEAGSEVEVLSFFGLLGY